MEVIKKKISQYNFMFTELVKRDFNKRYKKTVVIITHNENVANMADRVFYIKDGKLDRIVENEHPISPEEVKW